MWLRGNTALRLAQVLFPSGLAMWLAGCTGLPGAMRLPQQVYRDKCTGAWAGQMVGVTYGEPYQFQSNGRPILTPLAKWQPERVEAALRQDDVYAELTFLAALEKYGLDVTAEQAGRAFADAPYPLWHANLYGRENIRKGIMPPLSGAPPYNRHCDDIDESPRNAVPRAECRGCLRRPARRLSAQNLRRQQTGQGGGYQHSGPVCHREGEHRGAAQHCCPGPPRIRCQRLGGQRGVSSRSEDRVAAAPPREAAPAFRPGGRRWADCLGSAPVRPRVRLRSDRRRRDRTHAAGGPGGRGSPTCGCGHTGGLWSLDGQTAWLTVDPPFNLEYTVSCSGPFPPDYACGVYGSVSIQVQLGADWSIRPGSTTDLAGINVIEWQACTPEPAFDSSQLPR